MFESKLILVNKTESNLNNHNIPYIGMIHRYLQNFYSNWTTASLNWWLVKYLTHGNGVASWHLGDFFPFKVKNIIFTWRGACKMRLNPCDVRLNIPAGGEHGPDVGLRSGGQGWGWRALIWYPISPIWYAIQLSGIPSPYLLSHPYPRLYGRRNANSDSPSQLWRNIEIFGS